MGRLYKRGDTYYADYLDRAGVRRRESTHTGDRKVAAARLRDRELATTDRAPHQTETLAVALDYFTDVVHAGSPKGTRSCYQQKARHLSRLLGDELLDHLKREDYQRYIATRIDEGAHPHSVHKELVVLRGSLRSAKERDRFHAGLDVVPEFDAQYTPRTTYLTPDQFHALCLNLVQPRRNAKPATLRRLEDRRNNRALYCMLAALASSRRGELEALQWEHVDFARDMIRIPKGKTISRVLKIHPVLRPWLEALAQDSGPIVQPWGSVTRDLADACRRAGVPRVTCNDLRRTFASWLVQSGESLYVVSRLLGHKSTRMVELVYGQLDDATLSAAILRMPGCDAGVPREGARNGTSGTHGTAPSTLSIVNSVEESANSAVCFVPRDGVEPPTRGFSGLGQLAPKPSDRRRLLRAVK